MDRKIAAKHKIGGRINMTIVLDELVSILTDFKTFFYAFSLLRNVLLGMNTVSVMNLN